MIMSVTKSMFCNTFKNSQYNENFSYDGLRALYDYFEEINPNTELDLPVIAQQYEEFNSLTEIIENYPTVKDMESLQSQTVVITADNGHIIIGEF